MTSLSFLSLLFSSSFSFSSFVFYSSTLLLLLVLPQSIMASFSHGCDVQKQQTLLHIRPNIFCGILIVFF